MWQLVCRTTIRHFRNPARIDVYYGLLCNVQAKKKRCNTASLTETSRLSWTCRPKIVTVKNVYRSIYRSTPVDRLFDLKPYRSLFRSIQKNLQMILNAFVYLTFFLFPLPLLPLPQKKHFFLVLQRREAARRVIQLLLHFHCSILLQSLCRA